MSVEHEWQPWPETRPKYNSGFYQVKLTNGDVRLVEMINKKFQINEPFIAWRYMAWVGVGSGSKQTNQNR